MKAGTILFHGTDLGLYGKPRFTLKRNPEPAAPARATHRKVEVTVSVALRAEMPATVWARARALQNLLASTPEGLLEIRDENGTALSWMATPGESSLPEVIGRRSGLVNMSFTATEAVSEQDFPLGMTIDPLDGGDILTIARPGDWNEAVRISRPDSRLGVRQEVASNITFTARTAFADPLAGTATRAGFLLAEAERLNAIGSREARLQFAGFDRVVQFESMIAKPSAGWEWIDLEAQARYVTLPGDSTAEISFTVDSNEDPATGETRTTISGQVAADDEATANAKVDAILAAWRTSTRRVAKVGKKDNYLDGGDCETPEWTGLSFTLEFTEGSAETRYTLKVDTREGADGSRITYSGSAYASTLSALLATVESASGGKHPLDLGEEISVEYATDDEGVLQLHQATFSHEYQIASTSIRGKATRNTSAGRFSDGQTTLSGSITAPDYATARLVARSLIPSGVILRSDEETEEKPFVATYSAPSTVAVTEQFITLAFSYAWSNAHTNTCMTYEDASNPDYTRMVEDRTVSGTVWAVDKATAQAAAAALVSGLGLSNPTRSSFSSAHEREIVSAGGLPLTRDNWLSYRFSYSFETAISGSIGHDIIEANFALQRIGMVEHEPVTEIPLNLPVKQTAFGYNMGRMVASGSVKARLQSTARTWGQGKRASAASTGSHNGAQDPPDERMAVTYIPFNGVSVAFYEFSFQYSFRYASGLAGLWPSSGLTL